MNCRAWVVTQQRRRKGSGKPYVHVKSVSDAYDRWLPGQQGERTTATHVMQPVPPATHPEATLCGGDITITVAATDEPYYGGTSATFDLVATCQRCGHTYHGTMMPTSAEEVGHILTEWWRARP